MKDVQQSIEKGFSDLTRFAHIFFALSTYSIKKYYGFLWLFCHLTRSVWILFGKDFKGFEISYMNRLNKQNI